MKKNILIAFLFSLLFVQTVYTASHTVNNPAIMHVRLREFIAAGALQGYLSTNHINTSYAEAAQESVKYADALLVELDK